MVSGCDTPEKNRARGGPCFIIPSIRKGNKYMVNYNGKSIHFGSKGASD